MAKTFDLKPKNRQDLEGSSQSQSAQTMLALPLIGRAKSKAYRAKKSLPLGRRRTLARMMRVELEVTLGLLNQALEQADLSNTSDT